MTEWPARRVADRILCGRQVAGRYVCQGEIATVGHAYGRDWARLPRGLYTEPGSEPPHWILQARVERGSPARPRRSCRSGRPPRDYGYPALPLTRDCPHCRSRNAVTDATLALL